MTTRRGMVRAALGGMLGGLFVKAQAITIPPRTQKRRVYLGSPGIVGKSADPRAQWAEVTLKDGSRYSMPIWS
jgi:hypothetical protein